MQEEIRITGAELKDISAWAEGNDALVFCVVGATADGETFSAWSDKCPRELRRKILENELANLLAKA